VAQDDIDGEIARIMAKSMQDANIQVKPKYKSKAISRFRFKTVRDAISSVCSDTQQSNPCYLSTGIQLKFQFNRSRSYSCPYWGCCECPVKFRVVELEDEVMLQTVGETYTGKSRN
jgi:hypothetical protein